MVDESKKSIPQWQLSSNSNLKDESAQPSNPNTTTTTNQSHAELLEQARDFLEDESIRSASHERKVEFLQTKGLSTRDIQALLGSGDEKQEELKTIHDSTTKPTPDAVELPPRPQPQSSPTISTASPQPARQDVPPIITYPEFLMKPQKPPPLVTFERLANAAYILAGASALTYGASKYIVEPMIQALTEARHDLASTTLEDLEKLNNKLESSVSHVPYIPSTTSKLHENKDDDDDDSESIDSDPTELFHRDIATQTTPQLSRSSSSNSLSNSNNKKTPLDMTSHQTSKLTSLHGTLQSLVSSIDPSTEPFAVPLASKKLQETVSQFQAVLDKLENTYNPFRSDYSSVYSSITDQQQNKKSNSKADSNEAVKFKAEIRGLKGAFLSSRNFPTARPLSGHGYTPR